MNILVQMQMIRNEKKKEYLKYANENNFDIGNEKSDVLVCGMIDKKEEDIVDIDSIDMHYIIELNRQYFSGEI